jgi:predicted phage terminase large subunit-like protein
MQRLHESDISAVILDKNLGYDHIMLPMRYDPSRAMPTKLGYEDPREDEGELLFPERFPLDVVERDENVMGPYATAGQFQQIPEPRGGGVIKREWWQLWERDAFPPCEYIIASLDTAYTTKAENDYSAMTVWGIFSGGDQKAVASKVISKDGAVISAIQRKYSEEHPKVVMMFAWQERLELHHLVEKVTKTMKDFKVDKLLIENKAAGHSVAQEIRRLFGHEDWGVQLVDPKGIDKLSRLYAIQHLFAEGLVYAPDRQWADTVIGQVASFPKGKHDDLVDTVSMALSHLRQTGIIIRGPEFTADVENQMTHKGGAPAPLYSV